MTLTSVAILFNKYHDEEDREDKHNIKSDTRKLQFKYVTDLMRSADMMSECSWRETVAGKIILTMDILLVSDITTILVQDDFVGTTRNGQATYSYMGYLF